MAWDVEIDPEFQTRLDWSDACVRQEGEPIGLVWGRLEFTPLDDVRRRAVEARTEEVSRQVALAQDGAYPELEVGDL